MQDLPIRPGSCSDDYVLVDPSRNLRNSCLDHHQSCLRDLELEKTFPQIHYHRRTGKPYFGTKPCRALAPDTRPIQLLLTNLLSAVVMIWFPQRCSGVRPKNIMLGCGSDTSMGIANTYCINTPDHLSLCIFLSLPSTLRSKE